ncbi:MAG: Bax inhibitor-1/YccA family protein [Vagococcus sp.]
MDNNQNVSKTTGLSQFFSKVYGYLGLGLAVSGVTSYLVLNVFFEQVARFVNASSFSILLLWIAQMALVVYLGKSAFSDSKNSIVGYIAYSALTGVTLGITLSLYAPGTIVAAFVTTAATFIGMSLVGVFVKKDLSAMGHALYSLVIGIIIASLLNMFLLKSSPVDFFISLAMVVVFSGLTAYDNQKIKVFYQQYGDQATSSLAIYCALTLYLDLLNLFLAFLRIFGRD